ncbi:MAG: gliding motility protein GldN [Muribaculaceae bacterium]|nr:gliding motility protein GldN [Muribaculaceae bacterium]
MNILKHIATLGVAIVLTATAANAQNTSTSSAVSRSSSRQAKETPTTGSVVTQRMEQRSQHGDVNDADIQWMRIIYRQLNLLDNDKNTALYFPEEPINGQENLFRIIMRLLANNRIPAYEYLDGREVFTDEYRIKVGEMLDRFQVLYTPAKGSTEKNPQFTIEDSDVPSNEVLSYYLLEQWTFDRRSNEMKTTVKAICPVLHRSGDFGGDAIKYPMFWIQLDDLRPYLTSSYIFTDDDNNQPTYTYDDYFTLGMYDGEIYKTRNLRNKSMAQLYPDPDALKRAQDSIQNRLDTYAAHMWVPSREEIIAAREAREKAATDTDTIAIRSTDNKPATTRARSTRAKDKSQSTKVDKPKAAKPKSPSSSSSATRSVRRRR